MANGTWFHEDAIATTTPEVLSGWIRSRGLQARHHRGQEDEDLAPWLGASLLPEERLDVLKQRQYVQALFQKQQEAEALTRDVWLLWSAFAQQLGSIQRQLGAQQQQLEAQQREIDILKRRLHEHPFSEAPAVPDAFQYWMMEHRAEVAAHRGRHIAVHFKEGIVASADNYASLVDELERKGVPDDHVVIEFVPLSISAK